MHLKIVDNEQTIDLGKCDFTLTMEPDLVQSRYHEYNPFWVEKSAPTVEIGNSALDELIEAIKSGRPSEPLSSHLVALSFQSPFWNKLYEGTVRNIPQTGILHGDNFQAKLACIRIHDWKIKAVVDGEMTITLETPIE